MERKRVSFSVQENEKQEESYGAGERRSPIFKEDNKEGNWFQRQFLGQPSQDYDSIDSRYVTAVAAAAFAINSLEEAELQRQFKSRRDDSTAGLPSSGRASRRFSNTETMNAGNKSMRQGQKAQESGFPTRHPSGSFSSRPTPSADRYPNRMGNSSRRNDVETKADAWEKAKMEKINMQYEKTKSNILAWENEKKNEAKIKMERIQSELDERRAVNLQHYKSKIATFDKVAAGAKEKAEETRRNQELEVKEKAKKIRSTGKVPVNCFYFYCH